MTRTLRIGGGLNLPLETVTQAIAILAKRRAGKSYTARRLVEQLARAGQQVVIVDPKGDWWGIRSSRLTMKCPRCNGAGVMPDYWRTVCGLCIGDGTIEAKRRWPHCRHLFRSSCNCHKRRARRSALEHREP